MKIFNLHGYHANNENAAYFALKACGYDVVSPAVDYDSVNPEKVLDNIAQQIITNHADVIVGSSVGGFFALLSGIRFSKPVVAINPAIIPALYLPRLGYNYPGGARELFLMSARLADIDLRLVSTIVGTDDEVIDSREYTRVVLGNSRYIEVAGGKHSGGTLGLEDIFRRHGKEFIDDVLQKNLL